MAPHAHETLTSHAHYADPFATRRPQTAECPPLPPCPACGRLECLCRPRFFAGQLLTEEDLNRLEGYIVAKNRLHNRYLHGWGVVCGLEVVCDPCGGVRVRPGYALSPCGDDIIVCREDPVNVCDLINACREVERPECDPPHPADPECEGVEEPWVLSICYEEKPSRGITALRGGSGAACCSKCSCGGSSSCGCGCHPWQTQSASKGNGNGCHGVGPRPYTPPQCEPTLTCESYYYRVYKPQRRRVSDDRSFQACIDELQAGLQRPPDPKKASVAELHAWCCEQKEYLYEFLASHPTFDCSLLDDVRKIQCPDPARFKRTSDYHEALKPVLARFKRLVRAYVRYCRCSSLLPACPEPVDCNCVPLATITVRKRDCRVLRICNWEARQFVATFPQLKHWLEDAGAVESSEKIARLCCPPPHEEDEIKPVPGAFHRAVVTHVLGPLAVSLVPHGAERIAAKEAVAAPPEGLQPLQKKVSDLEALVKKQAAKLRKLERR